MTNASLKSNIPTHELKISNGDVVVFYDYMTTGEAREIQKLLLEQGKYNPDTNKVEGLSLGVALDSQDKAASLVIKEVKLNGQEESQPFSIDWLANLPMEEGNAVYEEVNRLSQISQLTQDQKKG